MNHTIQCIFLSDSTGLFCKVNIDECYTKPCSPYGKCLDLLNGYQCQCKPSWHGCNCDRRQNEIHKSLITRPRIPSMFHLRNSSRNTRISKTLSYRSSLLPVRIQYEFCQQYLTKYHCYHYQLENIFNENSLIIR